MGQRLHCEKRGLIMYESLVKQLRSGTGLPVLKSLMYEAADAIEELQKKCKNWEDTACDWRDAYHHWFENYQNDVPKWISVEERLPEPPGEEVSHV